MECCEGFRRQGAGYGSRRSLCKGCRKGASRKTARGYFERINGRYSVGDRRPGAGTWARADGGGAGSFAEAARESAGACGAVPAGPPGGGGWGADYWGGFVSVLYQGAVVQPGADVLRDCGHFHGAGGQRTEDRRRQYFFDLPAAAFHPVERGDFDFLAC